MKTRHLFAIVFCLLLNTAYLPAQTVDSVQTVPNDSVFLKAGFRCLYGIGIPVDYDKARQYFTYLAKKNNPVALNTLGIMYRQGMGVTENKKTAVKYFNLAFKNGNDAGTCNLAHALRKGEGIKQNYKEAFRLYNHAAQNGYARGYYGAGEMTYKGYGTKQDYIKANTYFEKGAELGDKNCLYMLGVSYMEGRGKKQDFGKSEKYFSKALAKGHPWVEHIIEMDIMDSVQRRQNRYMHNRSLSDTLRYVPNKAEWTDMEGVWNGAFITYDWSGKEIEKETPLTLEIIAESDSVIRVTWIEKGNDKYQFFAKRKPKAWLIRDLETLDKNETTTETPRQIKLNVEKTGNEQYLSGNVLMVSLKTRDRMKPTSFKLANSQNAGNGQQDMQEENVAILNVFPNPFSNSLEISIKLNERDKIGFDIYDLYGNLAHRQSPRSMDAGEHTVTLRTGALREGHYIIHVMGRNLVKSNVLLKSK
jgi:TPR repeat protein